MSNGRRGAYGNAYRTGYLRSVVWFVRRDRWFREETLRRGDDALQCAACGARAKRRQLELHHVDYGGVTSRDGRWIAGEQHEDLIPLHPYCHELLHRLIDRDTLLRSHPARRTASASAIARLRGRLTQGGPDHPNAQLLHSIPRKPPRDRHPYAPSPPHRKAHT